MRRAACTLPPPAVSPASAPAPVVNGRPVRRALPAALLVCALVFAAAPAQAQLFSDSEARKAILDLRARVTAGEEQLQRQIAEGNAQQAEQFAALRRSLLELNSQLDLMRQDMALLRGANEELRRDVAELQRALRDANQTFDDRLRALEPQRVSLDGLEFKATQEERAAYDEAIATLRNGDFEGAAARLSAFGRQFPRSGYLPSASFWLGNALYGKRDYKGAVAAFRALIDERPDHPKVPEAMLALANSQAEMKDTRAARASLEALIKAHPASEAAAAGKERLAALR